MSLLALHLQIISLALSKSSARHFYLRSSPVALQARPMTNDPLYALRQSDSTFFFFSKDSADEWRPSIPADATADAAS